MLYSQWTGLVNTRGLAGEFGHNPIDPSGPICGCGQRGCWEVFASSSAALRYYAELHPKGRLVTTHDLLNMAEEGDAKAIAAVSRQATSIGRGLRLITAALVSDVILITGDITTSWQRFGPIIQSGLENTMLAGHAPRLEITSGGELSRLRGCSGSSTAPFRLPPFHSQCSCTVDHKELSSFKTVRYEVGVTR